MMDVVRSAFHLLGVAGEAGVVGLDLVFKTVTTAAGVAFEAVELARLDAGLKSQVV